jgi:PAS domain S-box-containing protein
LTTPLQVLVLGDQIDDVERMLEELCRVGFEPDLQRVETEADFLICLDQKLDLILSDQSASPLGPATALRLLRERDQYIPLIVIADIVCEEEIVACIRQGAADYLVKERLGRLGPAAKRALEENRRRAAEQMEEAQPAMGREAVAEIPWASEVRYRMLVEQLPAIIYTTSFSEDDTTFYVSPQIERILGFSQADWMDGPRLWLKHLHPDDRMRVLSELADSYASGQPFVAEYRLIAGDGRTLWFHDEASVARDDDGTPSSLQGVRLDVTERRQAEEALRQRNRELELLNRAGQAFSSTLALGDVLRMILEEVRHVLSVAIASIWLVEPETDELVCQLAVGAMAEDLNGWRLAPGQGIVGWVVRHNESLVVPDARTDERHFQGVVRQIGLDLRSILTVPMRASSRGAAQNRGQGVIGVLQVLDVDADRFGRTDLTLLESLTATAASAIDNASLYEQAQREIVERVRAEKALQDERENLAQRVVERTAELSAANAELARAARLKDEFLAAMSHELRTPLNAILGLSEALQEEVYGSLNERQLRSLRNIEESGRHLLELINEILDIAKIEAGKVELQVGPVSVQSVCQSGLTLIRQMAHKKQIDVSAVFDSEVTTIHADARRMKQILVNLLTNAVKFTPDGGKIGLEVAADEARDAVHFAVWDTGVGISEQEMSKLFQPFVQLDSSLSRRHSGTGLGLALVRRLIELHNGGVAVESEVGVGSRFTISLPWDPSAVDGEPDVDGVPASSVLSMAVPPPDAQTADQNVTVLLADDSEASIVTVAGYLQAQGYRVIASRNGLEAIQMAREERPDIILMDIQMPEMDGLEAIRLIRSDPELAVVPIIALTALTMPGDRERCLQAGASEYRSKPVSLKGLTEMVKKQLRRGKESHVGSRMGDAVA